MNIYFSRILPVSIGVTIFSLLIAFSMTHVWTQTLPDTHFSSSGAAQGLPQRLSIPPSLQLALLALIVIGVYLLHRSIIQKEAARLERERRMLGRIGALEVLMETNVARVKSMVGAVGALKMKNEGRQRPAGYDDLRGKFEELGAKCKELETRLVRLGGGEIDVHRERGVAGVDVGVQVGGGLGGPRGMDDMWQELDFFKIRWAGW